MAGPNPVRRGRPPKSDGQDTRLRLLDAAAATCADRGFDGATLHQISRRAGITAAAVYNHFDSREELLYAAGVRGLERMTEVVGRKAGVVGFTGIAEAYLRPDMADTRRLLAELHMASRRDDHLAGLLGEWHRAQAERITPLLGPDDPSPMATVKTLFLVLLGLCHLEDLDAVDADPDDVMHRVTSLIDSLGPPPTTAG